MWSSRRESHGIEIKVLISMILRTERSGDEDSSLSFLLRPLLASCIDITENHLD